MTGSDTSRRAFRIAYDGSDYRGFQRQPDVPTVSDAILDALRALDVLEGGVPAGYAAAGRTDAGVSASAQTVAFDAPAWLTPAALNAELPADVRAWAHAAVGPDFHATHDATAREYTYFLHAPQANIEAARAGLDRFCGRQDFHNLTPDETGTVRELSGDLVRDDPFLVITVEADGFPRQLVRQLVTVIEELATGKRALETVEDVLGETPLTGPDGIGPAPPEPLVLTGVEYPGVHFETDPDAAASARSVFGDRYAALASRARVSDRIRQDLQ